MLKKWVAFLAVWLLAIPIHAAAFPTAAQTIPDTKDYTTAARGAVVMDAQTGRVLYAQNANLRMPMASTTKIMSALLTLEQENLDEYFTVDSAAIRVEGSSMGLREGDSVSLRALAYGMLLPSGNDGANAAAVRIAGSKEGFAALMNERGEELGLEDTHFVTPSGLDDPQHYSTAYDMALLAREALTNPDFADICARSKAVVQYGNPPYNRWLQNHNRLLKSYEGAVGIKTGFTDGAGRCLVSAASRNGMKLIVVTLHCPDDWNTHTALYDRYFAQLQSTSIEPLIPQVRVPVTGGVETAVDTVYDPPRTVALRQGEQLTVRVTTQPFLYAPVKAGQLVGMVTVYCDGEQVAAVPLTAAKTVEGIPNRKSWLGF